MDNWQDVCGSYWKDIDGNYMFLYSKENKIILEYKDRLFPLDNYSFSCVFNPIECKDSQSEPVHEIWSFQIDGDDREETILFEGELFIDEETKFERCNVKNCTFNATCHFDRCNIIECNNIENCICIKTAIVDKEDSYDDSAEIVVESVEVVK